MEKKNKKKNVTTTTTTTKQQKEQEEVLPRITPSTQAQGFIEKLGPSKNA